MSSSTKSWPEVQECFFSMLGVAWMPSWNDICGMAVVAAAASLLQLCNSCRLTQCQCLEGPSGDHSDFAHVWACSPGQDFTFPFAELMRHVSAHSPAYGGPSGCQNNQPPGTKHQSTEVTCFSDPCKLPDPNTGLRQLPSWEQRQRPFPMLPDSGLPNVF